MILRMMQAFAAWYRRVSLWGVAGEVYSLENRRTQACNLIALTTILISIPFFLINSTRLVPYFFFPVFWGCLIGVLQLNKAGRPRAARLLLTGTLLTVFYALALILNVRDPALKNFFMYIQIGAASSALVLFSFWTDRWILLSILLLTFFQVNLFPILDPMIEWYEPEFTEADIRLRTWLFVGLCLTMIALYFSFYQRIARQAEAQIGELLTETREQHYELQVKEEEIRQSADELKSTNEHLTETLHEVEIQRSLLAQQHDDILESIAYARRIQLAILPPESLRVQLLPRSWVFYRPRDLVSGDFYFLHGGGGRLLAAVVDCTGHGVPGAFMSVMAYSLLNQLLGERPFDRPDELLAELDARVRSTLRQGDTQSTLDGMDVGLVLGDRAAGWLRFAGAGRPLYRLRAGQLDEWAGSKFPVGGAQHAHKLYTTHQIDWQPGDCFFLFTDGITDQFGGANRRKLTPRRLREWIVAHGNLVGAEQAAAFTAWFDAWQGPHEQLDDQTLFAFSLEG